MNKSATKLQPTTHRSRAVRPVNLPVLARKNSLGKKGDVRRTLFSCIVLGTVAMTIAAGEARAQNTVDNFTTGTDLTVPTDWSTSAVPGIANDAVFTAATTNTALTLSAATLTVGSFDDTAVGTANTVTSITNTSTATTSTLTIGGAGDLGNAVTGANSADLIFESGGTSAATAATFDIYGGTGTGIKGLNVVIGQSGNFDVGAFSVLNIGTAGTTAGTLSLGTFTITDSGAGVVNIGSAVAGSGGLAVSAGTTTVSGTSTFSGGVNISGGSFILNSTAGAGTGTITVSGGTLSGQNAGGQIGPYTNALAFNGNFTLATPSKSDTFSGAITLANTFTAANPLVITTTNNSSNLPTLGNTITTSDGNGIFDVTKAGTGGLIYSPAITLTQNEVSNVTAGFLRLSGIISGTGFGLTATGGATTNLTAADTYTGPTTVTGANLDLSVAAASVANSAVTVSNNSTGITPGTFTFEASPAAGVTRAASVTLGAGSITATGNATANSIDTITGAVTFDGTAFRGVTSANENSIITVTPNTAKNETLDIGSLARTNHGILLVRGVGLGTSSASAADTGNIFLTTAPTLVGGTATATATNLGIVPGVLGGTTATDNGSTFVTYNSSTGLTPLPTTAYVSTLAASTDPTDNVRLTTSVATTTAQTVNSLIVGTTAATALSGTGTISVTSGMVLLGFTGSSISAPLNFGSAEGIISPVGVSVVDTISGSIAGTGGLTIDSNRSDQAVSLESSTNTYTGNTYLLGRVSTYSTGGTFFPSGTRTGDMYVYAPWDIAPTQSINGLNGSGAISYGHSGSAAVFTLGVDGANGNFSGTLSGLAANLSIVKTGAGTQIFSGADTYTSTTTINGGALLVNGTHTGAGTYTVAGGTLGGTGSINTGANAINIGNGTTGGTITGGAVGAVGMLTLTTNNASGVVFNGASGSVSTYAVDLGTTGATSDNLKINGALTLTGTFDHITVTGTPTVASYDLINYTGTSLTGGFTEAAGDLPTGYTLAYNTDEIDLVAAVPEPSVWVGDFLGLGVLGFMVNRRRCGAKA